MNTTTTNNTFADLVKLTTENKFLMLSVTFEDVMVTKSKTGATIIKNSTVSIPDASPNHRTVKDVLFFNSEGKKTTKPSWYNSADFQDCSVTVYHTGCKKILPVQLCKNYTIPTLIVSNPDNPDLSLSIRHYDLLLMLEQIERYKKKDRSNIDDVLCNERKYKIELVQGDYMIVLEDDARYSIETIEKLCDALMIKYYEILYDTVTDIIGKIDLGNDASINIVNLPSVSKADDMRGKDFLKTAYQAEQEVDKNSKYTTSTTVPLHSYEKKRMSEPQQCTARNYSIFSQYHDRAPISQFTSITQSSMDMLTF